MNQSTPLVNQTLFWLYSKIDYQSGARSFHVNYSILVISHPIPGNSTVSQAVSKQKKGGLYCWGLWRPRNNVQPNPQQDNLARHPEHYGSEAPSRGRSSKPQTSLSVAPGMYMRIAGGGSYGTDSCITPLRYTLFFPFRFRVCAVLITGERLQRRTIGA